MNAINWMSLLFSKCNGFRSILFLAIFIGGLPSVIFAESLIEIEPIEVTTWQYQWGDSPKDPPGEWVWLSEPFPSPE